MSYDDDVDVAGRTPAGRDGWPRPTAATVGLVLGAVLGFAYVFGGFVGLLVVALFMIVGAIVGKVVDGQLDLADFLGGGRRRDR